MEKTWGTYRPASWTAAGKNGNAEGDTMAMVAPECPPGVREASGLRVRMLNDFSKTAKSCSSLDEEERERERWAIDREISKREKRNEKTVNVVGAIGRGPFLPHSANERRTFYGAELS